MARGLKVIEQRRKNTPEALGRPSAHPSFTPAGRKRLFILLMSLARAALALGRKNAYPGAMAKVPEVAQDWVKDQADAGKAAA